MEVSKSQKSIAQGIYEEIAFEKGICVLLFQNEGAVNQIYKREVSNQMIQFHFCVKGQGSFNFNEGSYQLPMLEEHALLLYNTQIELPIEVIMQPKSWMVSLILPITRLHTLFSNEANYIPFLSEENRNKKYYKDSIITPSMAIALNQLLQFNLHPNVKPLYFKAKIYELLSLYFNLPKETNLDSCPYLADEENVAKIKKAKEIVIDRMTEPPTLQELANEINLPLNKLKEGFKQLYGEPVFQFLFDYKMEIARQLLASGTHNVNEVGLKVGYSTASHFISAFKKKYGVTPKKFTLALNQ